MRVGPGGRHGSLAAWWQPVACGGVLEDGVTVWREGRERGFFSLGAVDGGPFNLRVQLNVTWIGPRGLPSVPHLRLE